MRSNDREDRTSTGFDGPILILGGTADARALANRLVAEGHRVITSLAGRTAQPVLPEGEVRTGGFGGWEGLARYLTETGIARIVDATHPFARRISENAIRASVATGIPLQQLVRQEWMRLPEDRWREVDSLEAAASALPSGAVVFLALGRQYLQAFEARNDCRFVIRMVDEPENPLPFTDYAIVLGRPASDPDTEANLFTAHAITHLVCRNSGGAAGYAKIVAARALRLPVIMIGRQPEQH